MEIRNDIYPYFRGSKRKRLLEEEVVIISEAFENFRGRDDVVKYLNGISDPKIAELFLETGRFYFSARFHYCPHCGAKFNVCPNGKCSETFEMPAHIVFIMIISIMERLSRKLAKHKEFYEWVKDPRIVSKYQTELDSCEIETFDELVKSLRDEYSRKYGSSKKISDFFRNFLTKDEKIEFIRSIRYSTQAPDLPPRLPDLERITKADLERHFQEIEREKNIVFETDEQVRSYVQQKNLKSVSQALPDCFDKEHYWKCYTRDPDGQAYGYCHYSLFDSHCRLMEDETLLDEYFEKTVKTIYNWRSRYVHDARLPPIGEIVAGVVDFYKKKTVIVEINTRKLRPTFEKMFKRFFDAFQVVPN